MRNDGKSNEKQESTTSKGESRWRRFFRAIFSTPPVPREFVTLYGRDRPLTPEEMRARVREYAHPYSWTRGLY